MTSAFSGYRKPIRAPPFDSVSVQGELRDHEDRPADFGDRAIHFVFVVGKDAQTDNFVGHPRELVVAIGVREADEQQDAAIDAASHSIVDSHFGTRYALQQESHGENVRIVDA